MHGLMLGLPLAALSVCGPAPPVWPARFVLAQRKVPDDRSGNSTVRRDPPSAPKTAWFVTTAYTVNKSAPEGYFKPPTYCNVTTV